MHRAFFIVMLSLVASAAGCGRSPRSNSDGAPAATSTEREAPTSAPVPRLQRRDEQAEQTISLLGCLKGPEASVPVNNTAGPGADAVPPSVVSPPDRSSE